MDEIHEECGIFGSLGFGENVASLAYFAGLAQQHRGQESFGIAASDGETIQCVTHPGRVDAFTDEQFRGLSRDGTFTAHIAISHNRYSNTGGNIKENFQPVTVKCAGGDLALAHNGNIISPELIAVKLKDNGFIPKGSSDSELIALLIALESYNYSKIEDAMKAALGQITGAYSLVIIYQDKLYGIRDPWGIRPLSLGRINGKNHLLASESSTFYTLRAKNVQELGSGQMVIISENTEPTVLQLLPFISSELCVFEFIYFASPGAIMYDCQIETARRHMGEELWAECPVEIGDPREWVVFGVPDSSTPAANGYAIASGLEHRDGIMKNRYIARTFMQPTQRMREAGVHAKFLPFGREFEGKKVFMVEDSIVRGTTIGPIVNMVRNEGAKEVHVGIVSPPYRHPCFMGTDTQDIGELVAFNRSVEEIRRYIGADSLRYLSIEGVLRAINKAKRGNPLTLDYFCSACFTGDYPFPVCTGQCRSVLE